MIRILQVTIQDFFSIQFETLDLREPLGLVLIEGRNGAGKSALVSEPILWAFKGETIRGARGDAVVRDGAKWASVGVVFESGGVEYSVTRYQKHPSHKNGIVLTGVRELSARLKAEVQKQLDALVPLSFEALTSLLILGEGFENRFTTLSARQKMEFLEWLVHEDWDHIATRANAEAQLLRSRQEYSSRRLTELKQRAASLFQAAEEFEGRRSAHVASIMGRLNVVMTKLTALHASALAAPPELPPELSQVLAEARAGGASAAGQLAYWHRVLSSVRAVNGVAQCPQCQQPVAESYVKDTLVSVQCQLERQQELKNAADAKINELVVMEQQSNAARAARAQRETEVRYLTQQQEQIQAELEQARAAQPPGLSEIPQMQAEMQGHAATLNEAAASVPYSDFWVRGFGTEGIRSYRMDGILAWLNQRLAFYCDRLYDGTIKVQLSPDRKLADNRMKNELVIEGSFAGKDYATASRSERRRADLAIHFALQDLASWTTGVQLNLLVADEVLDGMDQDSAERILSLLRERSTGTVFLVTHQEDLRTLVPTVWPVVKTNGVSEVAR